eukprot:TRINITY_DN37159_c0_g1_i2.p1 TRINITY_DN37159_c0_g1~~TRINITY_DN37159_c0_g1_i2.p1  ORF type:complete len:117 (+),score=4.91 TRINITY_DN37159_c0_g1_i2:330-680(+)
MVRARGGFALIRLDPSIQVSLYKPSPSFRPDSTGVWLGLGLLRLTAFGAVGAGVTLEVSGVTLLSCCRVWDTWSQRFDKPVALAGTGTCVDKQAIELPWDNPVSYTHLTLPTKRIV